MKRRLLITMMAVVFAFALTACADKNVDKETTQETETESEVKGDFIQFVGTDIAKADAEETEIMNKFNSYFAEGKSVDTEALLKDLSENIIPKYKAYLSDVETINVKTDEVKALKDKYYEAMNTQYQALLKVETAIKDKDKEAQSEAEKLVLDAKEKYTVYSDALYALAQKENVTLKGDVATTSITEAEITTETDTEAIDKDEVMEDDDVTTETAQ